MAEFDPTNLPSWSPEERQAFLDSLNDDDAPEQPLLAENLDEMDPSMLEALMQLRDGDEPLSELASDAKDRGNAKYKRAVQTKNKMFYREAAREYGDGLALCKASEVEADEPLPAMKATLYGNRAQCSLALRNFGEAIKDCRFALAIDGEHQPKCAYRLARACLGLKKYEDAGKACSLGLAASPKDEERETLRKTADAAAKGLAAAEEAAKKKAEADKRTLWGHREVYKACAAQGIPLGPAPSATGLAFDAFPALGGDDEDVLRWPVVFDYPESPYGKPDLVEDCDPADVLAEWMIALFPEAGKEGEPTPWDMNIAYGPENVLVYVRLYGDASERFADADAYAAYRLARSAGATEADAAFRDDDRWLEVNPAASFRDVLAHPKYVAGGPLVFECRPKGTAAHAKWRASVKVQAWDLVAEVAAASLKG
mmetsp:Transcript_14266/g.42544  ORF Transcript_14266/g.42544 Transcript_14266/m.42544 type:complete len:427 (+) Transcript_14266:320-1600(+)